MKITNPEHNYLSGCIYELVFVCSNKTGKDAKEVSLQTEQQKNAFYSIISGGNTQGQKK